MKQSFLYALFSALLTALLLTATSAPAEAAPAPAATELRLVPTADLDLSTPEGKRQLEQRLARAAREVCGVASDTDLEGKNAIRECRRETFARSVLQSEQMIASAARRDVIAVSAAR